MFCKIWQYVLKFYRKLCDRREDSEISLDILNNIQDLIYNDHNESERSGDSVVGKPGDISKDGSPMRGSCEKMEQSDSKDVVKRTSKSN